MNIVYSWLKEVVDIRVPAEELAGALTGAGLEVARIRHVRVPSRVRVARIIETTRHPNADHLVVCKVDAGPGSPLTIVCGAPNTRPGMVSALALEGAKLAPDFTIKKTKLRGVESSGMLCSERELGLSDDHSGILELPPDYAVGRELSEYYPDDAVIELEIIPSRGDCLSVIGIGREVAARYCLQLKKIARLPVEDAGDPLSQAISVSIEAPASCPRYAGRLVRGVTVKPSPEWMQRRLTLAGLRPINNIVDITNYLLLLYGQPMHAFDYDLIHGKTIAVRQAGGPMAFKTLDETERTLAANDLIICDGRRPVALAGIMGGAGSEITPQTKNVFIECAFFNPAAIRTTARRLGLSTDSSYRFVRGVDPGAGLIEALDAAAALMQELGGGTVAAGRVDALPSPLSPRSVCIRTSRANRLLGHSFTNDQISAFLTPYGITCTRRDPDTLSCAIPLFRHDLAIEVDLIEEVGRIFGYDAIAAAETAAVPLYRPYQSAESIIDTLRGSLAGMGLREIVTNSLTSEKKRGLLTPALKPVELRNPLSPEMAQLRTTLAGSMLEAAAYNNNRKNADNKFFEIGRRYTLLDTGVAAERDVLGILIEGNWPSAAWNATARAVDFYTLKGCLELLATHSGLPSPSFTAFETGNEVFFETDAACVTLGSAVQGAAGRIGPEICAQFGLKTTAYYAELDITGLLDSGAGMPAFKPLPKFPSLDRDLCFVVPERVSAAGLVQAICAVSPLVESVKPFDLYRGEKLGPGFKSIAFAVSLRSAEKTLTDAEAEGVFSAIIASLRNSSGATLRT